MPLTPADVHNAAFSKPPIGKRGYNEDEVDAFLDLVEAELARLVEENNDLRQQVAELGQPGGDVRGAASSDGVAASTAASPKSTPAETSATQSPALTPASDTVTPPGGDSTTQAAKVLVLAQEMADRLTSEAKSEADQVSSSAKSSSEKLVGEARTKADTLTTDARTKSEAMLSDARSRSETMQRQAKEKAEALRSEAERKHTELVGSMNVQRSTLEKKIEELRTFEREYRTRLKTYLESQLQELGQRGSAAPAGGTRGAPGSPPAVEQRGESPNGLGARTGQGS